MWVLIIDDTSMRIFKKVQQLDTYVRKGVREVKTQDESMEDRVNRYLAFIHSRNMLRVTRWHLLKRRILHSLSNHYTLEMIGTSWLLGFYGAGLMVFGWWFMCGYVPTLPQPLPPLINWSVIGVLSVFAATVDKIRKGE